LDKFIVFKDLHKNPKITKKPQKIANNMPKSPCWQA
jgi:hypothetical protein